MTIELISEFVELAKYQSVTNTARALNMSQPTLSKHIKQLESTLNLKLFYRTDGELSLTREGLDLLNEAYPLIDSYRAFMERAKQLSKSPLPRLVISGLIQKPAISDLLLKALPYLGNKYGTSFLETKDTKRQSAAILLENGALDVYFEYAYESDYKDMREIEVLNLAKLRWYAIVDKSHPLASQPAITAQDLNGCTLLKHEGTHHDEAWNKIEEMLLSKGVKVTYHRVHSLQSIDLVSTPRNLGNDVFIVAENYANIVISAAQDVARAIPLTDEDAFLPIACVFHMNNGNPMLDDFLQCLTCLASGETPEI